MKRSMNFDFSDILIEVVKQKASDLHLTAGTPPMIRQKGSLVPLEGMPKLTPTDTREIIYAILNSSQRQRLETDWQIDFAYSVPGHGRFRVNAYFQRGTLAAAFRLIPSETVPLEKLGMPPVIRTFAKKPRGLVLVTGPTGSGKSTTLASIINEINETRDEHILTIEDPIEFLHNHKRCIVNQRELGADAPSFALGLKAALRQDPDVILVGEMRDMETIGTALTAAETGHLVFATLHTQDAPQTVDRIIDVFPPAQQGQVRAQLAIGLQGIVTQTLIPTADGVGRCVAAEVLVPTPGVRNLIREGKTHQIYSLIQTGGQHGMQTMDASLAGLVREGRITMAAAESRASEPAEMRKLVESLRAGGRLMSAATYTLQGRRRGRHAREGRDLRRLPRGGHRRAEGPRPDRDGPGREEDRAQDGASRSAARRSRPQELTVMTRQLATMISSGMTLLRAFYVLEEQVENKKLKETLGAVREDIESGLSLLRGARQAPEGLQPALRRDGARRRGRRRARGGARADRRPAREGRHAAPPGQVGDGVPDRRARVRARRAARADRVHRPRVRRGLQGVRRRAAADHEVHRRHVALRHGQVVPADRDLRRRPGRLQEVAQLQLGPPAVGPDPHPRPVQDRRHRAEDRARPLVAHVLRALLGRRADHAGDRGDRPDRRQRPDRGRDGRPSSSRSSPAARSPRRCATPRSSRRWSPR